MHAQAFPPLRPCLCRQPLEVRLGKGREGLLATPTGDIFEGLVSNFFVVRGATGGLQPPAAAACVR